MKKSILLPLVFIFALTTGAYADFYTWTDKDGAVHITDYPPTKENNQGQDTKIYKGDNPEAGKFSQDATEKKPDIILFTKNECPDCEKAREYLKDHNLTFTEYNADTDENVAEKRKEFDSSDDVPFAVINRSQVYGFSEKVYERVIKAKP